MERILLRKLTMKSKFNFGKFKNLTVEELISLKPTEANNYLRWVYFNMSKISFTDNILQELLNIKTADLINKPGTDKSNHKKEIYYPGSLRKMKKEGIMVKGNKYREDKLFRNKTRLMLQNRK